MKTLPILLAFLGFAISPARGWWCEGHQVAALIAEKHLSANARAAAFRLLKDYPAEPGRACAGGSDDPLALASTWADDAKATEKTGAWHYMDIPLGLKKGDPEAYCPPIGPSNNGGERPGCVLSGLRYSVNVLTSDKETEEEKARALRYLIHLVADLHQPLHTTTNNDRGGNCTPVQFFGTMPITNLHAVWDGMMLERELGEKKETIERLAAELDREFSGKRAEWVKSAPHFDKWAWETHLVAMKMVYSDLSPAPPVERYEPKPDCKAEAERFGALHIQAGEAYETAAVPVMEEQLAKAGYRMAEILNIIWP